MRGAAVLGARMMRARGLAAGAAAGLGLLFGSVIPGLAADAVPRPAAERIRAETYPEYLCTGQELKDYLAGNARLPHFKAADLNRDGKVTARDALHRAVQLPVSNELTYSPIWHDLYFPYVPDAEFVLLGADERELPGQTFQRVGAYDRQGHLLSATFRMPGLNYFAVVNNQRHAFNLRQLFPFVYPEDVGYVQVHGNITCEGFTQSGRLALPAVKQLKSVVEVPYVVGRNQFSTDFFVGNVSGGEVTLRFPQLPEVVLDGSLNPWGYATPDLTGAHTGSWVVLDDFFSRDQAIPWSARSAVVTGGMVCVLPVLSGNGCSSVIPTGASHEFLIQDVRNKDGFLSYGVFTNNSVNDAVVVADVFGDDGYLETEEFVVPANGQINENFLDLGFSSRARYATFRSSEALGALSVRFQGDDFVVVPSEQTFNWSYIDDVVFVPDFYMKSRTYIDADVNLKRTGDVGSKGKYAKLLVNTEFGADRNAVVHFHGAQGDLGYASFVTNAVWPRVIDLSDLALSAGVVPEDVTHIQVSPRDNSHIDFQNTPLHLLLEVGDSERTLEGIVERARGVRELPSSSLFDMNIFVGNATTGLENKDISGEANDTYYFHIRADSKIGNISGISLTLYDSAGNLIPSRGVGGGVPDPNNLTSYVDIDGFRSFVNSEVSPDGGYYVVASVGTDDGGMENGYLIKTPIFFNVVPERDYDVDALKGEGYSYDVSITDLQKPVSMLCELVSGDDVVDMLGDHYTYEENLPYLQKLFDGQIGPGNCEASRIKIWDTRGNSYQHNAGALEIIRTDGHSEGFYTSSEATVLKWLQFYSVK